MRLGSVPTETLLKEFVVIASELELILFGAWLADRVIGPERTLFYAAVGVMLGHIALALAQRHQPAPTLVMVGMQETIYTKIVGDRILMC